jgi:hypothetical protein
LGRPSNPASEIVEVKPVGSLPIYPLTWWNLVA